MGTYVERLNVKCCAMIDLKMVTLGTYYLIDIGETIENVMEFFKSDVTYLETYNS